MSGGGRQERARRGARPGVRSPLTAVVATLALIVQLVALPYHQALSAPIAAPAAADVSAVAANLRATFGDAAALCVQTGDQGAPAAPAGDCDDHCPLCQLASHPALVAPNAPALPDRLDAASLTLGAAPETGALPFRPASRNRARAPPFAV